MINKFDDILFFYYVYKYIQYVMESKRGHNFITFIKNVKN